MLKSEEILETLAPLNIWGREQEKGVERAHYLEKAKKFLKSTGAVIAIIGVRRAGKTFLSKQLLKYKAEEVSPQSTLYVLLEDPKFDPFLSTELLEEIYQTHKAYVSKGGETILVLDEIQNVRLWEKWVRVLLERGEKTKIIITGSSSKLLFSKLATVLTGRTLTLEMFPLSFKEFLGFKKYLISEKYELASGRRRIEKHLNEYLTYGGFPQVVLEKDAPLKSQLLKEIFEGILYRDVVARYKTKEVALVKTTAEIGINNFSLLGSATRIRNVIAGLVGRKVSPNLILHILSSLEEAFLIYQVPIFSFKVKEQKLYPKKYYAIDTGLINAVTIKFSENFGRVYENVVAISLLREKGKENVFYWRSKEQEEVDFVVKAQTRVVQLIQVCYELADKKSQKREERSLLKAAEELNCDDLLVVTRNMEKEARINGRKIAYQPLWKWLLEKERI